MPHTSNSNLEAAETLRLEAETYLKRARDIVARIRERESSKTPLDITELKKEAQKYIKRGNELHETAINLLKKKGK